MEKECHLGRKIVRIYKEHTIYNGIFGTTICRVNNRMTPIRYTYYTRRSISMELYKINFINKYNHCYKFKCYLRNGRIYSEKLEDIISLLEDLNNRI